MKEKKTHRQTVGTYLYVYEIQTENHCYFLSSMFYWGMLCIFIQYMKKKGGGRQAHILTRRKWRGR